MPQTCPNMDPLKLITMTIESRINTHINLDVVANFLECNDMMVALKYQKIKKGLYENTDDGIFKNQCSFLMNMNGKKINVKLFNNGKTIHVGCLTSKHCTDGTTYVIDAINNLSGTMYYDLSNIINTKRQKKFFTDMKRTHLDLMEDLVDYMELCDFDRRCLVAPRDGNLDYMMFLESLKSKSFVKEFSFIIMLINIFEKYFDKDHLPSLEEALQFPKFQQVMEHIRAGPRDFIECVFPAHINEPVVYDMRYEIRLINKGTDCNFFVDREACYNLLPRQSNVTGIKYNKERYAGVITTLQVDDGHKVKIILFNTGSINITSAKTHEQIEQAYDFIKSFCKNNFDRIIFRREYDNIRHEYESSLPDIHHDETSGYFLLNKRSIIANPRLVRLLNRLNLLDKYRV